MFIPNYLQFTVKASEKKKSPVKVEATSEASPALKAAPRGRRGAKAATPQVKKITVFCLFSFSHSFFTSISELLQVLK